jgi:hypothetical protein
MSEKIAKPTEEKMGHTEELHLKKKEAQETLDRISAAGGLEAFLQQEGLALENAFPDLRRLIELNGGSSEGVFSIGCIDEGVTKLCGVAAPGVGKFDAEYLGGMIAKIIDRYRSELETMFDRKDFVQDENFWKMFKITSHHDCGAAGKALEGEGERKVTGQEIDAFAREKAESATMNLKDVLADLYDYPAEISYRDIETINRPDHFHPATLTYLDCRGGFSASAMKDLPPGFTISARDHLDIQTIIDQALLSFEVAKGHGLGESFKEETPFELALLEGPADASFTEEIETGLKEELKARGWLGPVRISRIKIAV